jgi:hypothetical protein
MTTKTVRRPASGKVERRIRNVARDRTQVAQPLSKGKQGVAR